MSPLDKEVVHQHTGIEKDRTFPDQQNIGFALNMIKDSHDGGLPEYQSEPGNQALHVLPSGSQIIGFINGKENEIVIFFKANSNDYISLIKDNKYNELARGNFGFDPAFPISGEYRVKNGCDDIYYWSDHKNPDRWFNASKPDDFKTAGNFDINKFSFNPSIAVPNIDLLSVNDTGGTLQVGSYYFQIEVLDKNFNTVYKTDISPQTVIFDDSLTSSIDNIDGDVNYPQFDQAVGGIQATSKSITLRFTNIDTSQTYIRINVAYQISANQVILAHQVASLLPISGSTLDWTYTGLSVSNGDTVIDYTSMLIPLASYESSYVMEQVQGRLLRANLKGKNRDYSQLQTFVNTNLTLSWVAEESRTDQVSIGNPKDPLTYWYKTNFQGDEVYAIGIQFLFTDGEWSPVIHKAGRQSTITDTQLLTVVSNGSVLGLNQVWLSDVEHLGFSLGQQVARWKVINTASITGTSFPHPYGYEGEFGYHESDQLYPTIEDCNGNPIYGSLAGTKIRHHRFPDRKLVPHINSNEYIVQLGIKAQLTSFPSGVVGFRLCMGERDDLSKTVTDSGYLTKALHHNYASPIPDNLFLTAMEMDYFDDSISPIPPPKKYGRYTSSNVLFNSRLTPADYYKFNQIYKFSSGPIAPGTFPYFLVDLEDPAPYDAKLYSIIMNMSYVLHTAPATTNYKIENGVVVPPGGKLSNVIGINVESNDWFSNSAVSTLTSDIEDSEAVVPGQDFATSPTAPSAYLRANNFYVYRKRNIDPYNNLFAITYKYLNLNPFYTTLGQSYNGDTLIVQQNALRSLVLPTDPLRISVDRFAHATYWRDRWEEQQFNASLRYGGITPEHSHYKPEVGDMRNVLKVASENPDRFAGYILKEKFDRIPEVYNNNADYNKQQNQIAKIPLSRDFDYCSECLNLYPHRIIFSPVSFKEEVEDKYRENLVNDYIDIPGHRGDIRGIKYYKNMLFVHCVDGTFILQPNPQTLQTNANHVYLTTGDFLSIPPQELNQTDLGFAGCQSKQAYLTNDFQHTWVDQKRGQIFGYNDRLSIISDIGLSQWFKENLPSEQRRQIYGLTGNTPTLNSAIPNYGYGVHLYYDPRYKRLIVTKRDRNALGSVSIPSTGMYHNGFYWDYYSGGVLITSNVPSEDFTKFEDKSWTMSFDFKSNRWISWHSYIPPIGFSDNDFFYTQKDAIIYKHLHQSNYQTFYSDKYDAIIEFTTFDINTSRLFNVHYQGYTYTWDSSNKQWLEQPETFNKVVCYNNNQSTGLLNLTLIDANVNPYANTYVVPPNNFVIKTDNNYKIADLFDMSIGQPVNTKNWLQVRSYGSYIDQVVNTANIDFSKNQYQWSDLWDKHVTTRLFFKPVTDSKILFILNQIQLQYSVS